MPHSPNCTDLPVSTGRSRRAVLAAAAGALAAACTSTVGVERPPRLTFAHRPPIRLAVAEIETVDRLPPGGVPGQVGALSVAPAAALGRWAGDRLLAVGGGDRARFVITDASLTETTASPAAAGRGGGERYQAVAAATLEILEPGEGRAAFAESRAERTLAVPPGFTLNQRDLAWFEMIEALMADFDADREIRIHRHLAPWVR